MKMCQSCFSTHQDNNWYLANVDLVTDETCSVHPVMSNRRVIRTLQTLVDWANKPAGFKHKMKPNMVLHFENGLISRNVAELILFDYEQPFIDLLIEQGHLIQQSNGLIQPTPSGRKMVGLKDITGLTAVEA